MPAVSQLLAELQTKRFYGSVEIKFEAGSIVLIRKTETFKPMEQPRDVKQFTR